MNRTCAKISKDKLKELVELELNEFASHESCDDPMADLIDHLWADMKKVEFCTENITYEEPWHHAEGHLVGYQEIGDVAFLGVLAGGDWEFPVFFIIYWDGKRLRAYVPSDGNRYNRKAKSAFGNHEESDEREIKELLAATGEKDLEDVTSDDVPEHDWALISKDIQKRFAIATVEQVGADYQKVLFLLREVWTASNGNWNKWIQQRGSDWNAEVAEILEESTT